MFLLMIAYCTRYGRKVQVVVGRIKILGEVSEAEREGSDVLGEGSKGFGEGSGGIGGSGD